MEVVFEKNKDCTYKMILDGLSLEALHDLESLRSEDDCMLLRRMSLCLLLLFKVLSEDDYGKGSME